MRNLVLNVNGKDVLFSTKDCTSSADFYFKAYDLVYKAFNTSKEQCSIDHDLFMSTLSVMNIILEHFLSN
jgi:hypothetical protein